MHARRIKFAVAAAVLGSAVIPLLPSSAQAHTCAQVRYYINGTMTPVGDCHPTANSPEPADMCPGSDTEAFGNGAGATVCIKMPAA